MASTSIEALLIPLNAPGRRLGVLGGTGLWDNLGTHPLLSIAPICVAAGCTAWTARQADLGVSPPSGWSASLVSPALTAVLAAALVLPAALRHRRARAR